MKNIVLIYLLFFSCNSTIQEKLVQEKEYKSIEIKNNLYCRLLYEKDSLKIDDEYKINKLINILNRSEELSHPKSLNMGYGFLDIFFRPKNENKKTVRFSIIFTLYDGVIVESLEDGKIYKNDLLEEEIRNYF